MDCNGNNGFASIRIDLIHLIDHFDCDPAQTDIQLKRVPVRAYGTGFDTFKVTGQQARQLPVKMARHTEAQRRALERSDTFIHDTLLMHRFHPGVPQRGGKNAGVERFQQFPGAQH